MVSGLMATYVYNDRPIFSALQAFAYPRTRQARCKAHNYARPIRGLLYARSDERGQEVHTDDFEASTMQQESVL